MVEFGTQIQPTKNATPTVSRLISEPVSNRSWRRFPEHDGGRSQPLVGDVFAGELRIVSSSRACEGVVERLQVRICFVRPRVGGNVVQLDLGIGGLRVLLRAACPSASVGLSRTATPGGCVPCVELGYVETHHGFIACAVVGDCWWNP